MANANADHMANYTMLMERTARSGMPRPDRTGTGTRMLFGESMAFDVSKSFPLYTLRKINFRSIVAEILWFLNGSTNVNDLRELGCKFWDAWADESGSIGPMYGKQWRAAQGAGGTCDQIADVLAALKNKPYDRRHVVSAWDPTVLPERKIPSENPPAGLMALAPCHQEFQFVVTDDEAGKPTVLNCRVSMRSVDLPVGAPHNIAGYALLMYLFAAYLDYTPGLLVFHLTDAHVYSDQMEPLNDLIQRAMALYHEETPAPSVPTLKVPKLDLVNAGFTKEHVDAIVAGLENYNPLPAIAFPVAV